VSLSEAFSYSKPLELCSLRFAQTFLKEKRKKGKKEKRKLSLNVGRDCEQGFWIKYYPKGGDFIQNPQGLTL
tara:strand:- start:565 stop:780 length:216 start_codon:yes stop_codon:yes gene_type:complete